MLVRKVAATNCTPPSTQHTGTGLENNDVDNEPSLCYCNHVTDFDYR